MRFKLQLQPQQKVLRLPLNYNSLIQGFIYRNIERTIADWLHKEGTPFGKRQFRFFTFSRFLGRYHIDGQKIEFSGPVTIHISSVHERILQSLAKHLLKKGLVQFGKEL